MPTVLLLDAAQCVREGPEVCLPPEGGETEGPTAGTVGSCGPFEQRPQPTYRIVWVCQAINLGLSSEGESVICTASTCDTQPGAGITLCHEHTSDLERNLAEVDSVWEDLQVTVARLDVGGQAVGGSSTTTSKPPVNLDASDKAQTLEAVLRGWHSVMMGASILTATETASALLTNIPWIRKQDWAGDLHDELTAALEACRRATDRAADRITLGACGHAFEGVECPGTMTATVGGRYGRCRTCGATCDAQERQRWIIGEAWHVAAPLPVILRWLETSGHARIKVKRARAWVYAGKLEPVAEGMFTPAAVLAAHRTTPSGRMAA